MVTAHELGHVFWSTCLSPGDRGEYAKAPELKGRSDEFIGECFAEDFRLAFGSRRARAIPHLFLPGSARRPLLERCRIGDPPARIRSSSSPDGAILLLIEERPVDFPDVLPWREEGVTWAPLRPLAESLGWTVRHRQEFSSVALSRGQEMLEVSLDGRVAYQGSSPLGIVADPGRVCLPVCVLAQLLGETFEEG